MCVCSFGGSYDGRCGIVMVLEKYWCDISVCYTDDKCSVIRQAKNVRPNYDRGETHTHYTVGYSLYFIGISETGILCFCMALFLVQDVTVLRVESYICTPPHTHTHTHWDVMAEASNL